MRADDLDALLARVAGGEPEALALLIAGTRGDLRVLVANHAISATMVDEVLTAAWEEAYPRLGSAPSGQFVPWFWDIARDLLARVLGERDRAATDHKDPLAHAITRAGLDGLSSGLGEEVAALAELKRGVEGLEPAMQQLVRRRYADRLRLEVIAAELGQPEATVATTLFRARAAARHQLAQAEQLIAVDPLFPALVEDYVSGTLIPDARQLLAGSVIKDLEYCAAFEGQVRADLILVAMFAPPALEAARELAHALMTPVRTSQRLRAQRGSDRSPRAISDRVGRIVSDRMPREGTGRISDPRRRASSGPQPAAGGTGSFRRPHDAPAEAADRSGGPWTIIGIAAVVLAAAVGAFFLNSGSDDHRPRRHAEPAATSPPPSTSPTTAIAPLPTTPATPRPRDPAVAVVPRTVEAPPNPGVAPPPTTVTAPPPVADGPPTAVLTPPATLMVGGACDLVAAVAGVGIARVEFLADGAVVGEDREAPFAVAWTPARAGGVRLQVRVTDARARIGLSEIVLATVAPAPAPSLAVRLSAPAVAASFSAPASIPLSARIEGGMVDKVEFLHGEAKLAEKLAPPYEATWNRVPAGTYQIRARAWSRDSSVTSDPVTVVVTTPATQPPSVRIESPAEFESIPENQKAMIRVRAVDKDGVIARVEFLVDGQKIGDDTTLPYSWVWPKPAYGEHVVTATAFDDRGSRGDAEPIAVVVGQKTITRYVRGVSFGEAAEMDGYRLLSLTDAIRDGFNVGNGKVVAPAKPPAGDLDINQRALFAHVLTTDEEQLRFSQALPDGFYAVYAWVADTGETGAFDLELEGAKVGSLGKVAKGGWARFGPFDTRVADGALNAVAIRRAGPARLAGLAIYGVMVDQPASETGMSFEWWNGLPGGELGTLTSSSRYPSSPDGQRRIALGEVGDLPTDTGGRASAWVVPPATGVYRFFVRGDDQVEASLGADETPAKMTRVAFCPVPTDKWDFKPEQQSGDIPLVAGHRYFLRVVLKCAGGPNWLSVGWKLPDGTLERPLPASRLIPVPVDGVRGLVALTEASRRAHARPGTPDATPPAPDREQAIRVDYFADVPPMKVGDAVGQGIFDRPPTESRAAAAFETSRDRGDRYAARIRGEFRPPAAGSYRFVLECDDHGEVWLAPIDEPAARQKLVMASWDRKRSDPVTLDPARTYRLETLYTENDQGDWCRVGWELPDGTAEMPIPAARFLGPTPPRHGLKREIWRGIGGATLQDLLGSPAFKGPANHVDWILGSKALDDGIEFGERLSGWLVPAETGDYGFMMENDDGARFSISDNDSEAGLQPRFSRDYVADFNSNVLPPRHLEAGKRYRIEILLKQGGGASFVGLGWIKPNGVREPIPRECVVPLP